MAQVAQTDLQIVLTLFEGVLIALPVWMAVGRVLIETDDEVTSFELFIFGGFLALFMAAFRLSDILLAGSESRVIVQSVNMLLAFILVLGVGMMYASIDLSEVEGILDESWLLAKNIFIAGAAIMLIYGLILVLRAAPLIIG